MTSSRMKRCLQGNRVETDEALRFCRADGATLVSESSSSGSEAGTAWLGSTSQSNEIETSILPHKTDAGISRATGPTTALPAQTPAPTGALAKPKTRKTILVAAAALLTLIIGNVNYAWILFYSGRIDEARPRQNVLSRCLPISGYLISLSSTFTDSTVNMLWLLKNLRRTTKCATRPKLRD